MISIPLYLFLSCYLIYLLIFLIFSMANVYHLITTGTFTFAAITITTITALWCILVLIFTYVTLINIDWYANMTLFGPGGFVVFQ